MDKQQRLELIKQRHQALLERENLSFGPMPVPPRQTLEIVEDMDAYREKTQHSKNEHLTSDEI